MTGTVSLNNTRIEILSSATQLAIAVSRTGDLTSDASLNVLLNGSTLFYPSASGYDGIKIGLSWNAGEGGTKTAITPIIPSSDKLVYLDVELVDLLRVIPGTDINGNIAIYQQGSTPSWIPSAPGAYFQEILVSDSGVQVNVRPVSFGTVNGMIGATSTVAGGAGVVPKPLAGDNTKFLRGDATWGVISQTGLASIEGVTSASGNIDLIGTQGIGINPDNVAKTITFSLPTGTANNQTLVWNNTTGLYQAAMLPSYQGATLIAPGVAGILGAPPAGSPNRYAAADGSWRSEGTIVGQTGGSDGKIVRITTTDNTWQNAANTDTVDDLYKAGLCFKQGGEYFKAGATITGLSGLVSGSVYYLDASGGNITTTLPIPSPTTRRVAIGKAIAADKFIFDPGEVITG